LRCELIGVIFFSFGNLSRVGPLHSSQPNLSVHPATENTPHQQQQQSVHANSQHGLSQIDATLVNGTRQPSVRFEDVRVYGVDNPLPGHSRWSDEELAQRHASNEQPMDIDVDLFTDDGGGDENFQVR